MPETRSLRIAACLGGTSLEVAALDQEFQILEREIHSTAAGGALMEAGRQAEDRIAFTLEHWTDFITLRDALLDQVGDAIRSLADRHLSRGSGPMGVGVSAPGAIHPFTGEVLGRRGALNLPAWGKFNLSREIKRRVGFKVRSINDAKAMALGALNRMAEDGVAYPDREPHVETELGEEGRSIRDFIELDPGTGLGGAYIVKGKVWFGSDPANPDPDVGEIWKLRVDPEQPDIRFEELASGRVTARRVEAGLAAEGGEEARTLLLASRGRLKDMLKGAAPSVQAILEREVKATGRYLGLGIRYLMNREQQRLGAPEIRNFVIGGGLVSGRTEEARCIRHWLDEAIKKSLSEGARGVRILFMTLGGEAGLYGSAALLDDVVEPG
jgi:predicted NBD/HSP70 family sugar kinase